MKVNQFSKLMMLTLIAVALSISKSRGTPPQVSTAGFGWCKYSVKQIPEIYKGGNLTLQITIDTVFDTTIHRIKLVIQDTLKFTYSGPMELSRTVGSKGPIVFEILLSLPKADTCGINCYLETNRKDRFPKKIDRWWVPETDSFKTFTTDPRYLIENYYKRNPPPGIPYKSEESQGQPTTTTKKNPK